MRLLTSPPVAASGSPRSPPGWFILKEAEQVGDDVVPLERMTERTTTDDGVPVPPSDPLHAEVPLVGKVGHDLLSGPFRDPDESGDVAQPDIAIPMDAQQDVGVVREERPRTVFHHPSTVPATRTTVGGSGLPPGSSAAPHAVHTMNLSCVTTLLFDILCRTA